MKVLPICRSGGAGCSIGRTFSLTLYIPQNKPVKQPKSIKTYRNPMFVAKEYAEIIRSGKAKNQADLARMLGVTRSRVNQFIRLLRLDENTQRHIEELGECINSNETTERKLRKMISSTLKKGYFVANKHNKTLK